MPFTDQELLTAYPEVAQYLRRGEEIGLTDLLTIFESHGVITINAMLDSFKSRKLATLFANESKLNKPSLALGELSSILVNIFLLLERTTLRTVADRETDLVMLKGLVQAIVDKKEKAQPKDNNNTEPPTERSPRSSRPVKKLRS